MGGTDCGAAAVGRIRDIQRGGSRAVVSLDQRRAVYRSGTDGFVSGSRFFGTVLSAGNREVLAKRDQIQVNPSKAVSLRASR